MNHIDEFTIQQFRGLRDLKLEELSQINLLVGGNNSGKTSVLEALSIFANPLNWRTWWEAAYGREISNLNPLLGPNLIEMLTWLFPKGQNTTGANSIEVSFSGSGKISQQRVSARYEKFTVIAQGWKRARPDGTVEADFDAEGVNIYVSTHVIPELNASRPSVFNKTFAFAEFRTFPSKIEEEIPSLPTQTVNPFSYILWGIPQEQWSDVIKAGMKRETIELLQFFDPGIEEIDLIAERGNQSVLSVRHSKLGLAPLNTFGSGLRRVFTLATAIPRVKNGLLLIDELENAIHTKALKKTVNWLIQSCKQNNVQLFATTHSLEAVDTVIDVTRDMADLTFYRLEQDKGQTTCVRFDKEMITQLREELGAEVR